MDTDRASVLLLQPLLDAVAVEVMVARELCELAPPLKIFKANRTSLIWLGWDVCAVGGFGDFFDLFVGHANIDIAHLLLQCKKLFVGHGIGVIRVISYELVPRAAIIRINLLIIIWVIK